MKRKQLVNKIEKKERFDYTTDEINLAIEGDKKIEYTSVKTYYNKIQNLLTSESYSSVLETPEQLYTRRRALEVIFSKRVEFILDQKISYMRSYVNQYNIYLMNISKDVKDNLPELFDITFYFNLITNPTSGFDYALALNSILYNYLFDEIKYNNSISIDEGLNCINNFMGLALNEWMHMLNLLYLEANEVYYNAGIIQEQQQQNPEMLTGEERKQALIEMGRPDLIDTDIQVGRF